MQQKRVNILSDEFAFAKFCSKEERAFGCKSAFMCNISCPLFRARQVQMLVNEKGMTIGEAHRASLHEAIEEKKAKAIVKEAVLTSRDKPSYPYRVRIEGEEQSEEDDSAS